MCTPDYWLLYFWTLRYFVNNLGNTMFDNYVINKEKYDFDILVKTF